MAIGGTFQLAEFQLKSPLHFATAFRVEGWGKFFGDFSTRGGAGGLLQRTLWYPRRHELHSVPMSDGPHTMAEVGTPDPGPPWLKRVRPGVSDSKGGSNGR